MLLLYLQKFICQLNVYKIIQVYVKRTPSPDLLRGGRSHVRLFSEIILDALNYSFCNGRLIWCVQMQDWGLVVVIIEPFLFLSTLPVELSGAVGLDVIAGSFKVIFVCKAGTIFVKSAVDMVAKSITNKTFSLVWDDSTLVILRNTQNIICLGICNCGIIKGFQFLCFVEVCLTQLLYNLLCELTASLVYYKYFFASPKCVQCHKKIPP